MQDLISKALLKYAIVFDLKELFGHSSGFTLMYLRLQMPQKSVSHYQTVAHFSPTGWQRFQGRHPFAELLMIVIQVDLYGQYSVTADYFQKLHQKRRIGSPATMTSPRLCTSLCERIRLK